MEFMCKRWNFRAGLVLCAKLIKGESLEDRRDAIEANAKLIAAAPELLEACKSMAELIRLAIEKAEGAK